MKVGLALQQYKKRNYKPFVFNEKKYLTLRLITLIFALAAMLFDCYGAEGILLNDSAKHQQPTLR